MRHEMDSLEKSRARVADITLATMQELVRSHHYSRGGSNTGVYLHGLFYDGELIGGAWWLPPTRRAAEAVFAGDFRRVLSLTRLVCVPTAPQNSASYLLGRSIRIIKRERRFDFLLTYADTWRGHDGLIYRATNWTYLGETQAHAVWVDAEGRMMGKKRGPRNLTVEQMRSQYTFMGRHTKHRYGLDLR